MNTEHPEWNTNTELNEESKDSNIGFMQEEIKKRPVNLRDGRLPFLPVTGTDL